MRKKALFFVALVVPDPLAQEIRSLQQDAATQFFSHAALRLPPHITLVPPFSAGEDQADQIVSALSRVACTQERFGIELHDFGYFGRKVIFINVIAETDLGAFSAKLIQMLQEDGLPAKSETRPYHPHVTIAYKDFRHEYFDQAMAHFRGIGFQQKFTAQALTLLKQDNDLWQEFSEVGFV